MFPTATVEGTGANLYVTHGHDQGLFVRFYYSKVFEKHYIRINIPGDKTTEYDRPVNDIDKQRFRAQWELYQSQQNQFGQQVMLKDWEAINDQQVRHLNAHNVMTVEHLASMSDAMAVACGMGTRDLVRKAQGYMAELTEKRKTELANQALSKAEAQIAILQDQVSKLMNPAPVEDTKMHLPKKASG